MFSDFKIDRSKTVYMQLAGYIKGLILKGMYQKDEKLPSTRELADLLKLSRNTVNCAYEKLNDDGLITIIEGKGAFISRSGSPEGKAWDLDWTSRLSGYGRKAEELDIIKHEPAWKKGMISFKSIAPDESLFDTQEFKRSFLNRLSAEGEKLLNYGYAQGYRPLISYLRSYMESKGVNTAGKGIIITNGFTEGFDLVVSALTEPGDRVLCENPTHNTALKIMRLHGLDIEGIDMEDDGINTEKLEARLKEGRFSLAYLIPSYHNPTGVVMSAGKRQKCYSLLKDHDVPVVEDGFNEELRYSGAHVSPIASFGAGSSGVVYIGSFSKVLFPGIRIGWILADERLTGCLESIKRSRNIHTSTIDQAVLFDYLQNGGYGKYIKKAQRFYKEKYEYAADRARKHIPFSRMMGSGGLHLFLELDGLNSRELLRSCLEKGVVFTAGDIFYTGAGGESTLRLGFSRVSPEDIDKGFATIGAAARELMDNRR